MENEFDYPDYVDNLESEIGSVQSYMDDGSYYSNHTFHSDVLSKPNYNKSKYKKNDSKYEMIGKNHYRTIIKDKNNKSVTIEFYMTKIYPGTQIRDAISGNYEKAYVGKADEDYFFKVKYSIGNDTDSHLFYSSPEDFERHFHTDLSVDVKQKWLEKRTLEN